MSGLLRTARKFRDSGELRELIKYGVITGVATIAGLALRYVLLYLFGGSHTFSLSGREFSFEIDDNFAYSAYYISSTLLMYLLKWFTARGLKSGTFLPRMIAFVALCLVSMVIGNALLAVLLRLGMHSEIAFWLTCPVTFLVNYLGSRLFVFRDEKLRRNQSDGE